jgi:hypothetical protein
MGLMKTIYTKQAHGENINYNPKNPQEWKVQKIPEGILNINDINKPDSSKSKIKKQKETIKVLEKILKKQKTKKELIKTASIKDVQDLLGKRYTIEPDKNYKCRRWIVIENKTQKIWRIRFNDPLIYAVSFIQQNGIAKFLKIYTQKSKYE